MSIHKDYASRLLRDSEKRRDEERQEQQDAANGYGGAYASDIYALSRGTFGKRAERDGFGGFSKPASSPTPDRNDRNIDKDAVLLGLLTGGGQKPLPTQEDILSTPPSGVAYDIMREAQDILDKEAQGSETHAGGGRNRPVDQLELLLGGPVPFAPFAGIDRPVSGGNTDILDQTAPTDEPGGQGDDPVPVADGGNDPIRSLLDMSGVNRNMEHVLGQYAANTGGRASSAAVSAAAQAGRDAISDLLAKTGEQEPGDQLKSLLYDVSGDGDMSDDGSGQDWKYWAEDYVPDKVNNADTDQIHKWFGIGQNGAELQIGRILYDLQEEFPEDYRDRLVAILLYLEDMGIITADDRDRYASQAGLING